MTTATLHAHVARNRFAHHLLAALTHLIPTRAAAPTAASTAAESASIEAQKVRQLASTYARTDPGFAADLYAAAARHEGLHAD